METCYAQSYRKQEWKVTTWRSCCCALSCCCNSNSFCIFSWVFCSCSNCSWYCCCRAGGKESCGSWGGSCAFPVVRRPVAGLFCSICACIALGFANGIHSLFDTCRDHLSASAASNFSDSIKQIATVNVRHLRTICKITKIPRKYGLVTCAPTRVVVSCCSANF